MHDCQKFREQLSDLVLSPKPADIDDAAASELDACEECLSFYQDACAVARMLSSAEVHPPDLSEMYWNGFEQRLRRRLSEPREYPDQSWMPLAIAAGILLAVTLGIVGLGSRTASTVPAVSDAGDQFEIVDGHIAGLDPGTIGFFEQSELFLRSFVKIEPENVEDLADAQARARRQLAGLGQRKEAVSAFAPAETVLDEYETVLRDIGNLEQSSVQDLTDIQDRITRNGMIASMKAYQPRVLVTLER